jgi:dUTP pyrophosphatase
MNVNIKRLNEKAVIPAYAKSGDAGMDLVAVETEEKGEWITYKTGLAMQIPVGHVGLLFPRSSVYKKNQRLANSVGVIDSGYRGEIMFKYSKSENQYSVGERVGQIIIMPYPKVRFEVVEELTQTDRSTGGFGSTGV